MSTAPDLKRIRLLSDNSLNWQLRLRLALCNRKHDFDIWGGFGFWLEGNIPFDVIEESVFKTEASNNYNGTIDF